MTILQSKLILLTATGTPSPQIRRGHRGSTFSSVRLSQKSTTVNPVRRNTTRVRGRSYRQKKVTIASTPIDVAPSSHSQRSLSPCRAHRTTPSWPRPAPRTCPRSGASIRSRRPYRRVTTTLYSQRRAVIGSNKCVCMCACVCVWEKEKEIEIKIV